MIALVCFIWSVLTTPIKSKNRRELENVGRNVLLERELIEQRSLFDLPVSHHDLQSWL